MLPFCLPPPCLSPTGHSKEIREIIQRNEVERKVQRQQFLSEGGNLAGRMEAEKDKVEGIKEHKLAELKACGVPAKYQAELERYKIEGY
jgi:hypothetical protein